jgi:predicted RNase H-like HicB family nuclease
VPDLSCGVVVERVDAERFRAYCPNFPDCEAVATTPGEARQVVEEAIARILLDRDQGLPTASVECESP